MVLVSFGTDVGGRLSPLPNLLSVSCATKCKSTKQFYFFILLNCFPSMALFLLYISSKFLGSKSVQRDEFLYQEGLGRV